MFIRYDMSFSVFMCIFTVLCVFLLFYVYFMCFWVWNDDFQGFWDLNWSFLRVSFEVLDQF